MAAGRSKAWTIFWFLFSLVAILLFAAAPIISALTAGSIASAHGCQLDEGSIHPCVINGTDYGETLYQFGVMGWFMLITVPTGLFLLVVWLAVALIHLFRRYRARA
ncbi:hypothetical protein ACFOEZ_14285 [Tianweitania populi]|uniref:Uncharacterized protein n=1 Tax=Tianweitania populi TaxID=1607949 RepID=A0A8J3GKI1_9HYPH|nr:hypothetical protein [Tianweitania populi]GHD17264.1 hypothetical protein GCM10016234_26240 [Tianweitania populi]